MPDSSLSRGTLLGRAYSVDNQGLEDSYEVLCPLKFRRSLPRIASYAGALAPNFRRLVPGKPPYPGAWPLNFRGYCPESYLGPERGELDADFWSLGTSLQLVLAAQSSGTTLQIQWQ